MDTNELSRGGWLKTVVIENRKQISHDKVTLYRVKLKGLPSHACSGKWPLQTVCCECPGFFFFLRELAYVKVQFGYLALSTMTPFWFSLLFRNLDQNNDLPQTCLNNIIEALLLLE
jgi:hypothetical protein